MDLQFDYIKDNACDTKKTKVQQRSRTVPINVGSKIK